MQYPVLPNQTVEGAAASPGLLLTESVRARYRADEGGIVVTVRRQVVMPSKRVARWCGLASNLSQDGQEAIFRKLGLSVYRMYVWIDFLLVIPS